MGNQPLKGVLPPSKMPLELGGRMLVIGVRSQHVCTCDQFVVGSLREAHMNIASLTGRGIGGSFLRESPLSPQILYGLPHAQAVFQIFLQALLIHVGGALVLFDPFAACAAMSWNPGPSPSRYRPDG